VTKAQTSSLGLVVALLCAASCKPNLDILRDGKTNGEGGATGEIGGGDAKGGSLANGGAINGGNNANGGSSVGVGGAASGGAPATSSSGGTLGAAGNCTGGADAGATAAGGNGNAFGGASGAAGTPNAGGSNAGGTAANGGAGTGGAIGTAGFAGIAGAANCRPKYAVLEPGPALKFDFDAGTGTAISDSSGNGANGSWVGSPNWTTNGRVNGAVTFGANQYVTAPSGLLSSAGAVTVAGWVKLSANASGTTLFDFGSDATNHFYLRTNGGTGVSFGAEVNGGTIQEFVSNYVLPLGIWKHVALTLSGTIATLFIDGLEVLNRSFAFSPSDLVNTTSNRIGCNQAGAGFLYGTVDDFRVYARALTASEVMALAPPGSDYVHFNFDETCGNTLYDRSSKGLVASLPNGGAFANGRVGGALMLDGSSQYVQLPSGMIETCTDLTAAMWVRRTSPQLWERLFTFQQGLPTYMSLAAGNGSAVTGLMQFTAKLNGPVTKGTSDEQVVVVNSTASSPSKGMWGHVAVVLQSGTGHLYFNGVEVSSNTVSIKPSDLGTALIGSIGQALYPGEPYLAGYVDDLRVACRAYLLGEIKALAQTDL
jgi:hypothetical protein